MNKIEKLKKDITEINQKLLSQKELLTQKEMELKQVENSIQRWDAKNITELFSQAYNIYNLNVYSLIYHLECAIEEKLQPHANFKLKFTDFEIKKMGLSFDSENGTTVLVALFYKGKIACGFKYNNHEYADDSGDFLAPKKVMELYNSQLWKF